MSFILSITNVTYKPPKPKRPRPRTGTEGVASDQNQTEHVHATRKSPQKSLALGKCSLEDFQENENEEDTWSEIQEHLARFLKLPGTRIHNPVHFSVCKTLCHSYIPPTLKNQMYTT